MSYKFNPFTGTLDYFEDGGASNVPDGYIVEKRTLTAGEAGLKKIVLANIPPIVDKVTLDIVGGTSQEYGTDFVVVGNELSWNGLGLDVTLSTGDKIRVIYPI